MEEHEPDRQHRDVASKLITCAQSLCENAHDPVAVWSVLHQKLLSPQLHFSIHQQCYESVYGDAAHETTIQPSWIPPNTYAEGVSSLTPTTHVEQHMQELGFSSYLELYEWSITHKNEFWMQAAAKVGIQ